MLYYFVPLLVLGGAAPKIGKKRCEKSLRISEMNDDVFREACTLLNIKGTLGQDWRALAGELDYNVTQVKVRTGELNPIRAWRKLVSNGWA